MGNDHRHARPPDRSECDGQEQTEANLPQRPPLVTIIPSPLPGGTVTFAVMVYDLAETRQSP